MTDNRSSALKALGVFGRWWFAPLFIVGGQVLMRLTGYTAWAEQVGQAFMLTVIFYLALLGPLLAWRCLWLLGRLAAESKLPKV